MKYAFDAERENVTIKLSGDIDIVTADDFKAQVLKILNGNKCNVIFDCKDLKFIDSTGLGTFVSINNYVTKLGGKVIIRNIKPNVKKIFTITKLNDVILIED